MFELTIRDKVYQFRFGMGFVREIEKTRQQKADNGITQNVGLQYAIAALIDEDPIEVVNILEIANKTEKDRVTKPLLDEYIEDENTDVDALFAEVLDFLKKANATKKTAAELVEMFEKRNQQNEQK
jgi:hypothetical protein